MAEKSKVGIISCSGEEIPGGTISRLATRRALELLRPQSTVTLCLPLFLAGEESERRFAGAAPDHHRRRLRQALREARHRGLQRPGGGLAGRLRDPAGDRLAGCHRSQRHLDKNDEEAVWIVSERIAATVDELLAAAPQVSDAPEVDASKAGSGACSCGWPTCRGQPARSTAEKVVITGLPLIFEHLEQRGVEPGEASGDRLLETVRVYHAIKPGEGEVYRAALVGAYQAFCQRRSVGVARA